jgi:hypothetical protein
MRNSVSSSVSLQRSDDRGHIQTDFEYKDGMPSTILISQMVNGKTSHIELTINEARFFQYILGEFQTFSHLVGQMEDKEEADELF